jgi:hypothetical protein
MTNERQILSFVRRQVRHRTRVVVWWRQALVVVTQTRVVGGTHGHVVGGPTERRCGGTWCRGGHGYVSCSGWFDWARTGGVVWWADMEMGGRTRIRAWVW